MRELNSRCGALAMDESRNAREHLYVLVFPKTQILGTDTRFRQYSSRFGEDERSAAYRAAAEMHEMPIRGETIGARILAHRRDDNPVAKQDIANLQAIEEHWAAPWNSLSWFLPESKNSEEYCRKWRNYLRFFFLGAGSSWPPVHAGGSLAGKDSREASSTSSSRLDGSAAGIGSGARSFLGAGF
jgi:hypothetical protein